jgi:hypothetical protein
MQNSKSSTASIPVRDEEGNFLFRKEWLNNYVVIDGPMSKVALPVTSTPNLYDPQDGTSKRYIVNTKAILRKDLPELKKRFGNAQYIKADALNDLFLSGTIWVNEGQAKPELPMKGEKILCNIDYVYSPQQGQDVLRITNIAVAPAQEGTKLDPSALWADDPTGAFAEVTEEAFESEAKK